MSMSGARVFVVVVAIVAMAFLGGYLSVTGHRYLADGVLSGSIAFFGWLGWKTDMSRRERR